MAFACGVEPQGPGIVYDACAPLQLIPAEDTQLEEREGIATALGMWRDVGVTGPRLDAITEAQVPVIFQTAPSAFRGQYETSSGAVYVNRRLIDPYQRSVTVAHELGHALGLPHVDPEERASLMNPGNLEIAPTQEDAEALARLWGECLDVP